MEFPFIFKIVPIWLYTHMIRRPRPRNDCKLIFTIAFHEIHVSEYLLSLRVSMWKRIILYVKEVYSQLYSATIYYLVRLNIYVNLLHIYFLDASYIYVAFDSIYWVGIFSFLLFTEFFQRTEVFPQTDYLPLSSFTYYKCVCGPLWVFTTFHDQINPSAIECSLHCILIFCFHCWNI